MAKLTPEQKNQRAAAKAARDAEMEAQRARLPHSHVDLKTSRVADDDSYALRLPAGLSCIEILTKSNDWLPIAWVTPSHDLAAWAIFIRGLVLRYNEAAAQINSVAITVEELVPVEQILKQ